MFRFAPIVFAMGLLAGCAGSPPDEHDFELTLLHINDHHSHLDPQGATLKLRTGDAPQRSEVAVSLGGFARVTTAIEELSRGQAHVLKLHAGDAITGTPYFTLERGRADADLMNLVCFDAFAVGNHEFDGGDEGLARFIDFLRGHPDCHTPVLSANVVPRADSPLGERIAPSVVVERGGRRIGIVGLTVSGKTMRASRPDPGTLIGDETAAAQAAIDALTAQGVDIVVVLSHVGYRAERALATRLSGVDVIVGGDSHSLLGHPALAEYGLPVAGAYPTVERNRDGDRVCVVQAWQYSAVVGELRVRFDRLGRVRDCAGQPHVLIGDPTAGLSEAEAVAIRADLAARPELRITAEADEALVMLEPYRERQREFGRSVVAEVAHDLCLRRVPGPGGRSRSALAGCNDDPHVAKHGGDVQQIVASALLAHARRFGGGDLALINAGGVRTDLPAGPLTMGGAYTLLPFPNQLVRLHLNGAEVRAILEDAVATVADGNTGAWPYGADVRWRVDMRRPRGERVRDIEVRRDGQWQALDEEREYAVVSHDYLADGRDGWDTFATITGERREDIGLSYTEGFIEEARAAGTLKRPPTEDFSTQHFQP